MKQLLLMNPYRRTRKVRRPKSVKRNLFVADEYGNLVRTKGKKNLTDDFGNLISKLSRKRKLVKRKRKLVRKIVRRHKTSAAKPKRKKVVMAHKKHRRTSLKRIVRRKHGRRTTITIARRHKNKAVSRLAKSLRVKRPFTLRANPVSSFFSKENFVLATGVITAGMANQFVLGKWGSSLPLANNNYGNIAWRLAIPFVAALAVSKVSKNLAVGMAVGGIAQAAGQLVAVATSTVAAATTPANTQGEYLNPRPMAEYLSPQTVKARLPKPVAGVGAAFPKSAW